MNISTALKVFDSLSQETRLLTIKLLVKHGKSGLAACAISDELGISQSTVSFHLTHLSHAGLVNSKKEGRSIIYAVNFLTIDELTKFLLENCCMSDECNDKQNNC